MHGNSQEGTAPVKTPAELNRIIENFVEACPDPTADQIAGWRETHPECANEIMEVAMLMLATSFSRGTVEDHRVSGRDVALVMRALRSAGTPDRRKDGLP